MAGLSLAGLALVRSGRVPEGMSLLDEATAAAMGGEVRAHDVAGGICCDLIFACKWVQDFERAGQWCVSTGASARATGHGGLFGICRAHYASVLLHRGDWPAAEAELQEAAELFERAARGLAHEAVLGLAELRLRQGRAQEAEELFERVAWHPHAQLGQARAAFALPAAGRRRPPGRGLPAQRGPVRRARPRGRAGTRGGARRRARRRGRRAGRGHRAGGRGRGRRHGAARGAAGPGAGAGGGGERRARAGLPAGRGRRHGLGARRHALRGGERTRPARRAARCRAPGRGAARARARGGDVPGARLQRAGRARGGRGSQQRAQRARARGAAPGGGRPERRRDRRAPGAQPAHRAPARGEHPHQAAPELA